MIHPGMVRNTLHLKNFASDELFLFFLFWHLGPFLGHDFPDNAWLKLTMI